MDNKERTTHFFIALALVIWASVAIGTSVSVWNYAHDTFLSIVAALNLLINIGCVAYLFKKKVYTD